MKRNCRSHTKSRVRTFPFSHSHTPHTHHLDRSVRHSCSMIRSIAHDQRTASLRKKDLQSPHPSTPLLILAVHPTSSSQKLIQNLITKAHHQILRTQTHSYPRFPLGSSITILKKQNYHSSSNHLHQLNLRSCQYQKN